MQKKNQRNTTDWSSYWALGHITSLPNAFSHNYTGEFETFWLQEFHRLSNGDRILDICSGNGSIALMGQAFSDQHHRDFCVTACDAANIKLRELSTQHPDYAAQLRAIKMLSRTPLNNLNVPEHSFDLITSQFGFEYTPWSESAAIVARLLKPGGHFAMVAHRPDSTIVIQMRYQQADLEFLAGLDLFTAPKKRPNTAAASKRWLTLVERTLNEIYQRFQANREALILRQVGEQLESIKQQAQQKFNQAHTKFIDLANQLTISHVTAADLTAMARRLEHEPNWHIALQKAGLQLTQQCDIRYETGDIAATGYVFHVP
ncbi:MAG: class I SAM-dependent methyltransferase [Halieaceae bacterium]|nr:class I SAM-dependent methyltransferase [Halieaceae bacterium]